MVFLREDTASIRLVMASREELMVVLSQAMEDMNVNIAGKARGMEVMEEEMVGTTAGTAIERGSRKSTGYVYHRDREEGDPGTFAGHHDGDRRSDPGVSQCLAPKYHFTSTCLLSARHHQLKSIGTMTVVFRMYIACFSSCFRFLTALLHLPQLWTSLAYLLPRGGYLLCRGLSLGGFFNHLHSCGFG
jgi:hypothetical protein